MRELPDNYADSVVTDPPYGLSKEPNISEVLTKWIAGEPYDHGHGGFMGKAWDSFVPHPDVWREVYRVLKPGGYALVFAGTRTQDLMTISLRLAGFEVRDVIEWLYFSGFPKSHDVSKAFDKREGAVREVVGFDQYANRGAGINGATFKYDNSKASERGAITAPATELARKYDGWGTALKPAHEPIIVVRKPLIGTVADNVEKYGTGAVNIDGCRIGDEERTNQPVGNKPGGNSLNMSAVGMPQDAVARTATGRFPANAITTDDDAFYSPYFNVSPAEVSKKASKRDRNADWTGAEIALEPKTSVFWQTSNGASGRPSSLALTREDGSEKKIPEYRNTHPTVKPTDLMTWLVRLVTPLGGTVLDPFAGSGSTLVAAKREGFDYIGIEREPEYVKIINSRLRA